jgi:Transposase DDE domain group 1
MATRKAIAYNGHFACTCYHPLFVFNQFGDLERCVLRLGNVHSADGWKDALEPVVARGVDADKLWQKRLAHVLPIWSPIISFMNND